MDITQILLTVGAVLGILVVAAMAILPTIIEAESHNPHS
ncbi:hypothetical protein SAMN04489747_0357 [Auraticoccus monumenti]|uniref:Uncharacterized protein n=1 Tax=Auraticoccus monumenti TaxID=675864 RepID=A0A1G6SKK8_9ACTN|nr:hypothetical protein SAMN04489747_0357 [Auraticoccus monumenti]